MIKPTSWLPIALPLGVALVRESKDGKAKGTVRRRRRDKEQVKISGKTGEATRKDHPTPLAKAPPRAKADPSRERARGTLPKFLANSCTFMVIAGGVAIAASRIAHQPLRKSCAMASKRHPLTTPPDLGQAFRQGQALFSARAVVLHVRRRMHLQP